MTTTTRPATLDTTAAGRSLSLFQLRPGRYIWHAGAFRLVTNVEHRTVRMAGGHVLHSLHANTVEVAR
jgi:hypothetical protein